MKKMTETKKRENRTAPVRTAAAITGGTRGIGRACVRAFAEAEAIGSLSSTGSSGDEAEKLKEELNRRGSC